MSSMLHDLRATPGRSMLLLQCNSLLDNLARIKSRHGLQISEQLISKSVEPAGGFRRVVAATLQMSTLTLNIRDDGCCYACNDGLCIVATIILCTMLALHMVSVRSTDRQAVWTCVLGMPLTCKDQHLLILHNLGHAVRMILTVLTTKVGNHPSLISATSFDSGKRRDEASTFEPARKCISGSATLHSRSILCKLDRTLTGIWSSVFQDSVSDLP